VQSGGRRPVRHASRGVSLAAICRALLIARLWRAPGPGARSSSFLKSG